MDELKTTRSVYQQILDTIGTRTPECGGILGAHEGGVVTEFYFDEFGTSKENAYIPNVETINEMLMHQWMPHGILMVGIVHSHANGVSVPSCGDISYGIRILQALDTVDRFYLPIVTRQETQVNLSCFVICTDTERRFVCKQVHCIVVDDEE